MRRQATEPTVDPSTATRSALALIVPGGAPALHWLDPDGPTKIGSSSHNAVCIRHPTVSREHCVIYHADGAWWVSDLDSTNGTHVDRETVRRGRVSPGALLQLGNVRLTVVEGVSLAQMRYVRFGGLVARSAAMLDLFHQLNLVARTDFPALILGESGTGKELVARALHDRSGREGYWPLNCAGIPDELVDSELFGHSKGAFTGAQKRSSGLFGAADGGTIFLDEIGELPTLAQAKLLRVLESGEVRPVGEQRAQRVDVRIIGATNRPIESSTTFRRDLFHRLNTFVLRIPPLRERPDDLRPLMHHFLGLAPQERFEPSALAALESLQWSGNVRELRQLLSRLQVVNPQGRYGTVDLTQQCAVQLSDAMLAACDLPLSDVRAIIDALRRHGGQRARAYRSLGMPRSTFYYRLSKIRAVLREHQVYQGLI